MSENDLRVAVMEVSRACQQLLGIFREHHQNVKTGEWDTPRQQEVAERAIAAIKKGLKTL